MPAFTSETAKAARAKRRVDTDDLRNREPIPDAKLVDELRALKPDALSVMRTGLRSRDAKIRHDSSRVVLGWLEKLDPRTADAPTQVIYMTAALPHDLFGQNGEVLDDDDFPAFVPGAFLPK
jgi:hypothetical protein